MISKIEDIYNHLEACDLKILSVSQGGMYRELGSCLKTRSKILRALEDVFGSMSTQEQKLDSGLLDMWHQSALSRDHQIIEILKSERDKSKQAMLKFNAKKPPVADIYRQKSRITRYSV